MRASRLMGVGLAITAVLAVPTEGQEVHRISGSEVSVYNLAGHTRVVRGSGSDVVVRVTRGGSDAARLQVETGEVGGRETLRIVYPGEDVIYPEMGRGSRTTVRVRPDGTFWGRSGSRGDPVEVRGSGRGLEGWADLVIEVPAGKDFMVNVAVGAMEAEGLSGDIRLATGSGKMDVSDATGSLEVDTGSGAATVTGVRGSLSVDTGSGSIHVRDVEGDVVEIDTGSGRVIGSNIRSGSLSVDTGSGSIELTDIAAPELILDTGSGSVDVTLLQDVERMEIDTGSGSVTVRAPENLGAQVEIDTGSGGIDLEFALQVRSVRRDHMVGTLGDGQGTIRIDTGSGAIRLLKN